MTHTTFSSSYKSPAHKLIKFFEKSRDNWKEKHKSSKIEIKRLENKVRYLLKSKESWRQETLALRKQIKTNAKTQSPSCNLDDVVPLKKTLK